MEFSETKCEIFQADAHTNLLSHMWIPDNEIKAIIINIHGGLAHAGDCVTPALFFKEHGIATFALDLRWHGTFPEYNKNEKNFFHINSYDDYATDIHKYYKMIRKEYPDTPVFIMGHSNGSLISLKYALSLGKNEDIKGFILSSPWLKNKVEISPVLLFLSRFIATVFPRFAITPDSLNDKLTHDREITKRHYEDEKKGLRGTKVSAKLGVESLKCQNWVIGNIQNWKKYSLFSVIAGKDYLADPVVSREVLGSIPEELHKTCFYKDNFHENYNEVNRDEIFNNILNWMNERI
ncbi:MAG: alpha/beta hydrolase [Desulfobacteraceae bacterium]|nr:alpha/beta hydrolase [Desulfobacteraceae bacterium]